MNSRIAFWIISSKSRHMIWKKPFRHHDEVKMEFYALKQAAPTDGKPNDWICEAVYARSDIPVKKIQNFETP